MDKFTGLNPLEIRERFRLIKDPKKNLAARVLIP